MKFTSSSLIAGFSQILAYLSKLKKEQQIEVGIMLGLSLSRLLKIGDSTFLKDLVHAWLQKEDSVIEWSGMPTWDSLAKALRKLGHTTIAEDIEEGIIKI